MKIAVSIVNLSANYSYRCVLLNADEEFVTKIVDYFKAWEYFLLKPSWSYWLFGAFGKHIDAM